MKKITCVTFTMDEYGKTTDITAFYEDGTEESVSTVFVPESVAKFVWLSDYRHELNVGENHIAIYHH